ncbi:MAG: hypothetical protein AB7D19_08850 [Acetobacter sp.]
MVQHPPPGRNAPQGGIFLPAPRCGNDRAAWARLWRGRSGARAVHNAGLWAAKPVAPCNGSSMMRA